ncbi:MAG: hypothetical protein A3E78_10995 [Alphaproteobacteria bacterium RIFCSPHIGHO2_12_FULL_63_12]|nr:MAG: hypothetical protein A3E78_10995 [Alphaproteobacteria bacterium RIFCSPHIGHO2_12_FULL_63_12]
MIYEERSRRRSKITCEAMKAGITAVGDRVRYQMESDYGGPDGDVAVFYGMAGKCGRIFEDYRKAGKPVVYIDLGYWGRRAGGEVGRWKGYHKLSVNARHPTAYFQRRQHDARRAEKLGLTIASWRPKGKHILVAGMGAKAANFEGLGVLEWERGAIREIRERTGRPIIFRPKPNCAISKPIPGTVFSAGTQPLADVLADCHAVVTHHSNVACDALLAGVPTFCWQGVAAPLSLNDLRQIEAPNLSGDRRRWLNDVSYCQYHVGEMTEGVAWRHLKDEGLVP